MTASESRVAERLRRLDRWCAPPMGALSLVSLAAIAVLLHFHEREAHYAIWLSSLAVTLAVWPAFVLEFCCAWLAGSPRARSRLWCCLLPPLRLVVRDHETGERIWLPGLGWQQVSAELRQKLERISNVPMIVIACLVLPLIAVEHYFADQIATDVRIGTAVDAATTVLWFAFALEFVVMCSIAENKFQYCKAHWLDLLVILLPLVAFLRTLRLGRLLRVQQVTKTVRIYRIKGGMMRAWRAVLVLQIVRRLVQGPPEQRLKKLAELIAVKEQELADLRAEQQRLLAAQAETANKPADELKRAA